MLGTNICPFCGKELHPEAVKCIWCKEYIYEEVNEDSGKKFYLKASLLCFFLGSFGAHRFYTGYTGIGIAQILTFGGFFGIWPSIDLLSIVFGNYKTKSGEELIKANKSSTNIVGGISLAFTIMLIILTYFVAIVPPNQRPDDAVPRLVGAALGLIILSFIAIRGDSGKKLGIISALTSVAYIAYTLTTLQKF